MCEQHTIALLPRVDNRRWRSVKFKSLGPLAQLVEQLTLNCIGGAFATAPKPNNLQAVYSVFVQTISCSLTAILSRVSMALT